MTTTGVTGVLMLVPVAASVLLWALGGRAGRLLPPATGVRLLTAVGVVVAAGTGFLAVAGFDLLARWPLLAAAGHWSVAAVRAGDPVPDGLAAAAALTVSVLASAAVVPALRAGRDLAVAAAACRRLGPAAGGLVILQQETPDAYALPGLSGRIVISTGMLAALPAQERRVLLAHEDAHLRYHHHLYLQAATLAAVANPLLRPLAGAVTAGVERWADEAAAAVVGDRPLAARALARAGLARAQAARPAPGHAAVMLSAADAGLADRARALLCPPPRRRRLLTGALAGLILLTTTATAATAHQTEHRFERAQATTRR